MPQHEGVFRVYKETAPKIRKCSPFLRFQLQHDTGRPVFCDHLKLLQPFSVVYIPLMK